MHSMQFVTLQDCAWLLRGIKLHIYAALDSKMRPRSQSLQTKHSITNKYRNKK